MPAQTGPASDPVMRELGGHQLTVTPVASPQVLSDARGVGEMPLVQAPLVALKFALWHGQWNCDPV